MFVRLVFGFSFVVVLIPVTKEFYLVSLEALECGCRGGCIVRWYWIDDSLWGNWNGMLSMWENKQHLIGVAFKCVDNDDVNKNYKTNTSTTTHTQIRTRWMNFNCTHTIYCRQTHAVPCWTSQIKELESINFKMAFTPLKICFVWFKSDRLSNEKR